MRFSIDLFDLIQISSVSHMFQSCDWTYEAFSNWIKTGRKRKAQYVLFPTIDKAHAGRAQIKVGSQKWK